MGTPLLCGPRLVLLQGTSHAWVWPGAGRKGGPGVALGRASWLLGEAWALPRLGEEPDRMSLQVPATLCHPQLLGLMTGSLINHTRHFHNKQ